MRYRQLMLLIVGLVLLVPLIRWLGRPVDPVSRLLPDEPAAVIAVLHGDETAMTPVDLARDLGTWSSMRIYGQLRGGVDEERGIVPILARWGEAMATAFDLNEYRDDAAFWATGDPALAGRLQKMESDLVNGDLSPDSLAVLLADHESAFRAAGYPIGTVRTAYNRANVLLKLGKIPEARAGFAAVLEDARHWNLKAEVCDALNSLALFALVSNDPAGEAYLVESYDLARRTRLAARAGRSLTVAGIHARRRGAFTQALELMEEAVAVCEELGQAWQGLPYLVYLTRFHAGLEDWRQVANLVPRAESMLREAEAVGADPLMVQREGLRLQELRLRALIHAGRVEEAVEGYPDLVVQARSQPFAEEAYIHDRQVRALLMDGRPDLALAILPEALASSEAQDQPGVLNLLLSSAEARLALDDLEAAASALARFEMVAAERPGWVGDLRLDALALQACLAHRLGDPAAHEHLQAALILLADNIAGSDASSLAYLELQRNRLLRQAMREILTTDPATSHGLELLWRRLPAWLGRGEVPARFTEDTAGLARDLARTARQGMSAGTVHLLFAETSDDLIRWTVDQDQVVCDTLALHPSDLHHEVEALLAQLSRDPGDVEAPITPLLGEMAESLANQLLPARVLTGPRPLTLLVSGDGALSLVPFAILDLEVGPGYRPLIQDIDLASCRDAGPGIAARRSDPALLVAEPTVAPRLRRRHPGLTMLDVEEEIAQAQAVFPTLTVLREDEATLAGLSALWERVGTLYFACHTVRSPESPYITFLPLSPGPEESAALATPYLDIEGIRGADFSNCGLVILASCASGAPYVSGRASAPSLGNAFLDAGAGAVIQTHWRVRDSSAGAIPRGFLDTFQNSVVAAFSGVQRQALVGLDGQVRHPFSWAAYSLQLRGQ